MPWRIVNWNHFQVESLGAMKAKQMSQVKSHTGLCVALFMPVLGSLIPSAVIQQALTFCLMWHTLRWAMGVEL